MNVLIYILGIIASNTAGVMLFDREDKLNRRTMLFTILISFFSWHAYIAFQFVDIVMYLKMKNEKNKQ